jgi:pimeloyl-ACP methyl ester carboxylesterase
MLDNVNGLSMHVLEAGFEGERRPLIVLLHGFPELAYSWRHVLPALANSGYWVVAPDQRGYGQTTGGDVSFDADLTSYGTLNLVQDVVGLLRALQSESAAMVVGHDFGAAVAAWCALTRPDLFRSVALMSAPFAGPPRPLADSSRSRLHLIQRELAGLSPPRQHYRWYYSTRAADAHMRGAAAGIHGFLRAYYHVKSADWAGNRPHPLASWSATELVKMPGYYVMYLDEDMPQTVARDAPSAEQIQACRWLPDKDLEIYSSAFERTGFQGGLNWYRAADDIGCVNELATYMGQKITVPACFIAGACDWGIHQLPGALQAMSSSSCATFRGEHLIEGAGHWVQQEQPKAVADQLLRFLRSC